MVKKPPTFCEIYIRNHLGIIEGSLVGTHATFKIYKKTLMGMKQISSKHTWEQFFEQRYPISTQSNKV